MASRRSASDGPERKGQPLNEGAGPYKRALFRFRGHAELTIESALIDQSALSGDAVPAEQLALSGPVPRLEADHIPVRGDLAHIRLAGKVFVPHYSVPLPRVIAAGGTELRRAGRDDADVMAPLDAGTVFNVLDMAGNWAWGQVGVDGLVGYVPLAALAEPGA